MGQLVKSFRAGVLIHTTAGTFRNGSDPTKEQAAALKALGYKLEKSSETLEPVTQTASVMRAEQIDAESAGRKEADERADKVARNAASTQGQVATTKSVVGDEEKTDGKSDDKKSDDQKSDDKTEQD